MKSRAAVAFKAGAPLEIAEVGVQGPRLGEVMVEIKATQPANHSASRPESVLTGKLCLLKILYAFKYFFLFKSLLTTILEFIHHPLTLEICVGGLISKSEAVSSLAFLLHLILS